ncbi:MAG: DUF6231 family protein [Thiobacillus sp.]|nr:DUF6231 family protein [Thiobacillus sp.]
MNWRDHLQARLLEIQPESVCALDEQAHQLAAKVLSNTPVRIHENWPGPTCALALGIDALNGLDAPQAQHLISQTRLYIAPRILLAVQESCALDEATFRALGFTLSATDTAENLRIYDYDLATYKMVPDWLNARYWAHPERWKP